MNNRKCSDRIHQLMDEFDAKIAAEAAEYREKVLVPLCEKHQLRFISGMGTFFFCPKGGNKDWSAGNVEDAKLAKKRFLIPYLEVLDTEISHGQYFGFWVSDIE